MEQDQTQQSQTNQVPESPKLGSLPDDSRKKKIFLLIFALFLLGAGVFYFGIRSRSSSDQEPSPTPEATKTPTPTEEPQESPAPTKKPTNTPTPKPTATPTPVAFAVTGVVAAVSPTSSNVCPTTFNFTANITTNAAGTVSYKWERSDGAMGATQEVVFDAASTKTVETTWNLSNDDPPEKWERLHVLSPNDISSNQATFTLNCP